MSTVAQHFRSQERTLAVAMADCRARVRSKVGDARAHALAALTETLRATPEGRPTAARLRRNRSYLAAKARLDELLAELVADGERIRVETYRESWAFWRASLPSEVLRPARGGEAPGELVERCRSMLWNGSTVGQFLGPAVRRAQRTLLPALVVAGNRATGLRPGRDLARRWSASAEGQIVAAAKAVLVDGQTLADRLAGRDVILPELLDDDPSLPTPR